MAGTKTRKPRTTDPDARIAMADAQIARFEKLVAERRELLEKTEALAAERKEALDKTQEKLDKLLAKRSRIVSLKERRSMKPEERKTVRSREQKQMSELKLLLLKQGKTIDDLLEEMK